MSELPAESPSNSDTMRKRIAELLRVGVRAAGGTQVISDATGIPKRTLDAYITNETSIPGDRLITIAMTVARIDPQASGMLSGLVRFSQAVESADTNQPLLGQQQYEDARSTVLTTDGQPPAHETRYAAQLVEIPLYRNLLSAGEGIMAVDDEVIGTRSFNRQWLEEELRVPPTMLALAVVRGDSMKPTLCSGDIVLIDKRDTGPARDDIYAVLLDGEVYVKRLQRGLDGSLDVISDNREFYKTLTLTSDAMNQREFGILGRVVWWAHTNAD